MTTIDVVRREDRCGDVQSDVQLESTTQPVRQRGILRTPAVVVDRATRGRNVRPSAAVETHPAQSANRRRSYRGGHYRRRGFDRVVLPDCACGRAVWPGSGQRGV